LDDLLPYFERIIVFLNTWIEKFPDDFSEPGMSELITGKLNRFNLIAVAFDVLAASTDASKEPFSINTTLEKNRHKVSGEH
jgi:hypothetical protein